jgi:regulator of protease activity HflC (stomatin/prohibitin superfamily)
VGDLSLRERRALRLIHRSPCKDRIDAAFGIDALLGERNEEKRMNEERISAARADMERRVAEFREKQAKFQREREDYYETTIEKVRATDWNEFVTPRQERRVRH